MEGPLEKKHFLWGVLLVFAPWLPALIGMSHMFTGINNAKATGMAAVAGGMVELLIGWGIASLVVSQVAAIL